MRTSGGDEVRAGDTYWLQGGIAASSMRPHPAGSPNKWGSPFASRALTLRLGAAVREVSIQKGGGMVWLLEVEGSAQ